MTEYWVSQGNKWCDFCKIYFANNLLSIRTHELGQRHKDNVAKRLASIQKESVVKEKEQKDAARALEQIEAKAKRSYQKDLAAFQEAKNSSQQALEAREEDSNSVKFSAESRHEWDYDAASGYYYNQTTGYYYDPNSALYFSSALGKWVKQEELITPQVSRPGASQSSKPKHKKLVEEKSPLVSETPSTAEDRTNKCQGPPPGLVISTSKASLNPMRSVKGAPSSIAVRKRRREDGKPKVVSKEEEAALKAREAAKKRVEDREKPLLGLYNSYR